MFIVEGRYESVVNLCRLASSARRTLTYTEAKEVHDALLACFLFGYLGPQRGKDVRSLVGPDTHVGCQVRGCTSRRDCLGNSIARVKVIGKPDKYVLTVSHHKTVKSMGIKQLILPSEISLLLDMYQAQAYPVLKHFPL